MRFRGRTVEYSKNKQTRTIELVAKAKDGLRRQQQEQKTVKRREAYVRMQAQRSVRSRAQRGACRHARQET
eukprot:189003-Pleurochrysis_carterae.AAC.2